MFTEEIQPQTKLTVNKNIDQTTRSEIKSNQVETGSLNIPDIAISLAPVTLIFSWVIFFITLRKIRSMLENKMAFTVKGLHKLPCINCQFYSNNHYLKCAVNPSVVLTEEAVNCSEYSLNKDKLVSQKFLP